MNWVLYFHSYCRSVSCRLLSCNYQRIYFAYYLIEVVVRAYILQQSAPPNYCCNIFVGSVVVCLIYRLSDTIVSQLRQINRHFELALLLRISHELNAIYFLFLDLSARATIWQHTFSEYRLRTLYRCSCLSFYVRKVVVQPSWPLRFVNYDFEARSLWLHFTIFPSYSTFNWSFSFFTWFIILFPSYLFCSVVHASNTESH